MFNIGGIGCALPESIIPGPRNALIRAGEAAGTKDLRESKRSTLGYLVQRSRKRKNNVQ